jgi:hypothetical protein
MKGLVILTLGVVDHGFKSQTVKFVTRSLVLRVVFCRSLFVLLYFFFWPLCCLFFFDIRILITSLWYLVAIVLSVLLWYTDSDYLPLVSCGHCVVCSSLIYGFWLPPFGILWPLCCLFFFDIRILITSLWYLQTLLIAIYLLSLKHSGVRTWSHYD